MGSIAEAGTFDRAVAQTVIVRLVATLDGVERAFRARIIQALGDDASQGIWIHLPDDPAGTAALAKALPACQGTLSVERSRYSFSTKVLKRERYFWVDDRTMHDALLLAPPTDLRRIEQRSGERLPVGDHSGVRAQLFWGPPEPPDPANPLRSKRVPMAATLRDLSHGGAGFICPTTRQLLTAKRGESLTVNLHFGGESLTLAASLAQVSEISTRTLRVGICFDSQASTARPWINRALAELERQQALRRPRRTA